MRSIYNAMSQLDATVMRVAPGAEPDTPIIALAIDVSKHVEWARYGSDQDASQVLIPNAAWTHGEEARDKLAKAAALDAVLRVVAEMARGRHEAVVFRRHPACSHLFLQAVHSTRLALDPDRHALTAGGLRLHKENEDEAGAIQIALNHSRAMSYKNAAARVSCGGSKLAVMADPASGSDGFYGWLGFCIDRSRTFTGPDIGLSPDVADILRERFTRHIVGGQRTTLGPTSWSTAEGVVAAAGEAVREAGIERGFEGATVGVQGCGEVGSKVSALVLEQGARLIIADVMPQRIDTFLSANPHYADQIEACSPDDILSAPVDVLMPCAMNGVIREDTIDNLRCRVLFGAANNELDADSIEEEIALARRLDSRGILFQIAWVHNVGGVIQARAEYERSGNESYRSVVEQVVERAREGTRENLADSRARGVTPTEAAYARFDALLYD